MGIFAGPLAYLTALGLLLRHPKLILLALIPAAVTLGLSFAGIWAAAAYGGDLLALVWEAPADGSGWLREIFTWITSFTSAIGVLIITPWLIMLVALPLCEPLIGATEAVIGGREVEAGLMEGIINALKSTVIILVLGLGGTIVFGLLSLIPGVGIFVAPFVMFVWTPLFVAFDLCDGSFGRRNLTIGGKLSTVTGNLGAMLGLGLIGAPLLAVPFLNLLGLPLAVIAGVLVVRGLERKDRLAAA